jgi:hypothetical protein
MVYTTDDGTLLGLWTAIRLIGIIREIQDPMVRAEILTKAQILLTAFCVELKPQSSDQISSAPFRTGPGEVDHYDAKAMGSSASEADGGVIQCAVYETGLSNRRPRLSF